MWDLINQFLQILELPPVNGEEMEQELFEKYVKERFAGDPEWTQQQFRNDENNRRLFHLKIGYEQARTLVSLAKQLENYEVAETIATQFLDYANTYTL